MDMVHRMVPDGSAVVAGWDDRAGAEIRVDMVLVVSQRSRVSKWEKQSRWRRAGAHGYVAGVESPSVREDPAVFLDRHVRRVTQAVGRDMMSGSVDDLFESMGRVLDMRLRRQRRKRGSRTEGPLRRLEWCRCAPVAMSCESESVRDGVLGSYECASGSVTLDEGSTDWLQLADDMAWLGDDDFFVDLPDWGAGGRDGPTGGSRCVDADMGSVLRDGIATEDVSMDVFSVGMDSSSSGYGMDVLGTVDCVDPRVLVSVM